MYSYKVLLNKQVIWSVLAKNIFVPLAVWGIILLLGFSGSIIKETVLTIAIPTASISIMLAIQFNQGERDISSILFFSTLLSLITMGLFIWILP